MRFARAIRRYDAMRITAFVGLFCVLATLFVFSFGLVRTACAVQNPPEESDDSSNEIIVVCNETLASPTDAIADADVEVVDIEDLGAIAGGEDEALLVTVSENESIDAAISKIEESGEVLYAQPNYTYHRMEDVPTYTVGALYTEPNDSRLSSQYYLQEWKADSTTSGANVLKAWKNTRSEGSVTVAVIDSGVLSTHEDIYANLDTRHMIDIYNETEPGIINDPVGHGTHVAGIISGVADNQTGIAGVSYNARIVPIRVFSDKGTCSTIHLLNAFNYLTRLVEEGELDDLHVINMSLGDHSESANDQALRAAIATMRDKHQVLTVCAGGNGDSKTGLPYTSSCWPGDFDECLSVTALTRSGENWSKSDYNLAKDISAPGVSIYSTYYENNASYHSMTGTSMATPIVSGAAALLWAQNPDLSVDEVVEALKATAHPLDAAGENYHLDVETGSAGAIDVYEALSYVEGKRVHMSDVQVNTIADEVYDGSAHMPDVTLSFKGVELTENEDYAVFCFGNVCAGKATVVLYGMGNYVGSKKLRFNILPASLADAKVAGVGSRTYTGHAQKQAPKVSLELGNGTTTLKSGKDYTLSYKNNVNAGKATMTIIGRGNYTGTINKSFSIGKAKLLKASPGSNRLTFTGSARTPSVVVQARPDGSLKVLKRGTDYTVVSRNNKNVGTATLTVKGKGNYTGTLYSTYQIIPKGTSLKKLVPGKKRFSVQWYRQSANMGNTRINGYQIRYNTRKTFSSGNKYKTIKGYKNLTASVTGLQKGKTYYVQVRTIKTVYGKNYYSAWSKPRACRV